MPLVAQFLDTPDTGQNMKEQQIEEASNSFTIVCLHSILPCSLCLFGYHGVKGMVQ